MSARRVGARLVHVDDSRSIAYLYAEAQCRGRSYATTLRRGRSQERWRMVELVDLGDPQSVVPEQVQKSIKHQLKLWLGDNAS